MGNKISVPQVLILISDGEPSNSLPKQFLKQRRAVLQMSIVEFLD